MCIVVFGYQAHPEYRLILAANRDEFLARPTEQASWWSPDAANNGGDGDDVDTDKSNIQILSGKDGLSGGTWLGVSREGGRFAAVTNYRDGSTPELPQSRSRGLLVTSWLAGEHKLTAESFMKNVAAEGQAYNGFNLIIGNTGSIWYYSNRSKSNTPVQIVQPGVYGLSNELLDTPWPKVLRAKTKLKEAIAGDKVTHAKLFEIMSDPWRPPDEDLPDTNVGLPYERFFSAIFVSPMKDPTKSSSSAYGTCCSTVLTIDSQNTLEFTERSFTDQDGGAAVTPDAKFAFRAISPENHE